MLENMERQKSPYPHNLDERFFRELMYVKNKPQIQSFIRLQNREKQERKNVAKENDQLNECACCYDDELLEEDMRSCVAGHFFCK